ncbi:hypothetical protein [Mobilicoccus sp.]|uniref:hypothetical protein n=1 Tax=Mobilicoccus sp. TaxID=2034349 RepID=UPI0028A72169|nr:hypothetical protein [Mobilicoccus sp.]
MDATHTPGTDDADHADDTSDLPTTAASPDGVTDAASAAGRDADTVPGTADGPNDDRPSDDPSSDPSALTALIGEIEERSFDYEILNGVALRVGVPVGDAVMGVVPLLAEASAPVAVLAETRDGASALVMRDGQDLFVVKRSPGAWEHFRSRGGPSAIYGSWRSGERTRFRMRHGALWQTIPAAVTLAETLGVADLLPAETPPPPPRPAPEKLTRPRTPRAATRPSSSATAGAKPAASSTRPATKRSAPEPMPAICPRCFVQLPASGVCDCG